MSFNNPFKKDGEWYKGAIHVHTTNSDGKLSPHDAVKLYKKHGYDFMIITEHEKIFDYNSMSTSDFLLINGVEFSVGEMSNGISYHVVAMDIPADFKLKNDKCTQSVIDQIRSVGGESIIAHPYWYGMNLLDLLRLKNYIGIEVLNWGCEGDIGGGRGISSVHWDGILSSGRRAYGFAVDDVHYYTYDVAGGWIMVKAPELTKEDIMEAIRRGEFYSSSGPKVSNLEVSEDKIRLECDGARFISFVTMPTLGKRIDAEGDKPLTYCEVDISKDLFFGGKPRGYIRIELEDERGKRCWLNPIFLT